MADARVRSARRESHLHVVLPAKSAVVPLVIDINLERIPGPAIRRSLRRIRDVLAQRVEHGRRGLDAVAQEYIDVLASTWLGVSMELQVPGGRVAGVDLFEGHLEDRLRRV